MENRDSQNRQKPQQEDNRQTTANSGDSAARISQSDGSHWQSPEEFEKDKNRNPSEEDKKGMQPSSPEEQTLGDRVAGSDRSGTSELSSGQNSTTGGGLEKQPGTERSGQS